MKARQIETASLSYSVAHSFVFELGAQAHERQVFAVFGAKPKILHCLVAFAAARGGVHMTWPWLLVCAGIGCVNYR